VSAALEQLVGTSGLNQRYAFGHDRLDHAGCQRIEERRQRCLSKPPGIGGIGAHLPSGMSQAALDAIAAELNGRPRQTLGFKTPLEALAEALR
jgi:hypothetical protein